MALNVTTAVFGENCNTATASPSLAQWDTEQVLQISGIELPDSYKVEFSTVYTRNAIPAIGDASGVAIPNVLLQRSAPITAYVVLYGENGGRNREYWITIHITPGQPPETITPDPEQADVIDQAIAALNNGVAKAEAAAEAAEGSAEDAAGQAEDAEAWAVGQRGGADVTDQDPTYRNNAKYYAGAAEAAAEEAGQHEASWESWVRRAETAADDAEGSARAAAGSKADAETAAQTATQKATEAGNSAASAAGSASAARQTVDGAIGAINTARDGALTQIGSAGSNATAAVNQAGTTQTERVTTEGNTQVNRVQAKGDEVIGSIPQDYTDLVDDVADLSRQISDVVGVDELYDADMWEVGHITASDGTNASGDTYNRIRTKALIPTNVNAVHVADGYYIWIYCYDSDGVYQGIWKGSAAKKSWTYEARYTGYVDLKAISETWQYRLLAATTDGQTQLTPQDAVNFAFASFTDTTLTIAGRAADAKATGAALAALDKDYEVVDNYAGLLTSTKDKVLVLHNDSYYGDGGECWFEKLADKTVGGYVRTSDGARMYPCASQTAPVPCNVPKEDLLNVMMSYYKQTGFVYGQQHTLYLPEVTNEIDCSSFVSAVLAGITYDNSRYVKGDSAINTIGVSVGTNLNRYDADIGWDRFLTYEFPMYYGEQKRLFLMPSSPIEACNLLQFGDILLMYDDQDASRDKQFNVGHVAFVLNTIPVNNTVTIIQAGGVGDVIPKRNNESKVVKTTELALTSQIIASHIQAFVRPQYQAQEKVSNYMRASIDNFGSADYVFDVDFDINTAVNATTGRIEGPVNANFAATKEYIPVKSGSTIVYTGPRSDPADNVQFDPNIYEYDADYNFIQTQYIGNTQKTLSANTRYIRFAFGFNASKNKTITLALITNFGAKMIANP